MKFQQTNWSMSCISCTSKLSLAIFAADFIISSVLFFMYSASSTLKRKNLISKTPLKIHSNSLGIFNHRMRQFQVVIPLSICFETKQRIMKKKIIHKN